MPILPQTSLEDSLLLAQAPWFTHFLPSDALYLSGGLSPSRNTSLFSAQRGCFSMPLQSPTHLLGPVGHLTTSTCQLPGPVLPGCLLSTTISFYFALEVSISL